MTIEINEKVKEEKLKVLQRLMSEKCSFASKILTILVYSKSNTGNNHLTSNLESILEFGYLHGGMYIHMLNLERGFWASITQRILVSATGPHAEFGKSLQTFPR